MTHTSSLRRGYTSSRGLKFLRGGSLPTVHVCRAVQPRPGLDAKQALRYCQNSLP